MCKSLSVNLGSSQFSELKGWKKISKSPLPKPKSLLFFSVKKIFLLLFWHSSTVSFCLTRFESVTPVTMHIHCSLLWTPFPFPASFPVTYMTSGQPLRSVHLIRKMSLIIRLWGLSSQISLHFPSLSWRICRFDFVYYLYMRKSWIPMSSLSFSRFHLSMCHYNVNVPLTFQLNTAGGSGNSCPLLEALQWHVLRAMKYIHTCWLSNSTSRNSS